MSHTNSKVLESHEFFSIAALSFTFFAFQWHCFILHGRFSMKQLCSHGMCIFESFATPLIAFGTNLVDFLFFRSSGMTYYPPKSWAILIPTSLVSAFVAAPLLYAACNILATPRVDSIDAIWDEYSREPCAEVEPASNNG